MTDAPPGSAGSDADDAEQDAENVRAAMELRRQRPKWVVVWSAPLRRFSAGPLFRVPRGPDLTAPTISELSALMDQAAAAADHGTWTPRQPSRLHGPASHPGRGTIPSIALDQIGDHPCQPRQIPPP